jgi:hypothetical protein
MSVIAEVFGDIHKGVGWDSLGESLLAGQSAIMLLIVGKSLLVWMLPAQILIYGCRFGCHRT